MSNVAGHFCAHIGTVSQAVPAAMSQVQQRRHVRTRLLLMPVYRQVANTVAAYRENALIACRQAFETIGKSKRAYS